MFIFETQVFNFFVFRLLHSVEVVPKPSIALKVKAGRDVQPTAQLSLRYQEYYGLLRFERLAPPPRSNPRGGFETTSRVGMAPR